MIHKFSNLTIVDKVELLTLFWIVNYLQTGPLATMKITNIFVAPPRVVITQTISTYASIGNPLDFNHAIPWPQIIFFATPYTLTPVSLYTPPSQSLNIAS